MFVQCHYNGVSRVTRFPELMAIIDGFLACWQGRWVREMVLVYREGSSAAVMGSGGDGQGTGMSACHAELSVFLFGGVYVRGSMLMKLLSKHLFFLPF